jgi:transposase
VDACVKAGLLDLVDHAVDAGWSSRRAAARLGVDDSRLARWQHRRDRGELTDRAPGGAPLHGLLAAERAAILELFQTWGEIDRSHRKLAHRGSRLDLVHVSESTVLRVLTAEGIALPGNPRRDPIPRAPWPDWLEWKPNHIWAYDFTHFTRARRAAIAILDMGVPQVAHHPGRGRGVLHPGRGRVHRRPGRRGHSRRHGLPTHEPL